MGKMIRICAWCKEFMGEAEHDGDEELITHGICEKCVNKYFGEEKEDPDEVHTQDIEDFEVVKTAAFAPDVKELLDEIVSSKSHRLTGLRNVPGVDVKKAYEIFSALESSNRFIVGDSGTSFGKTQVQLGSFLNAAASDPNITNLTGLTPSQLKSFSSEWVKNQKLLSKYDWRKQSSVSQDEIDRNKSKAIQRMEGTIIRVFPNGQPGVVRIVNGKTIAEVLDLNVLQSYGFKVNDSSVRSKIDSIMKQFVTWAVVRNSLARVLTYQQMPDIHDKIMATFSNQNVSKNSQLSDLTDRIIQTNLSDKIEGVANAVKRYGYDTSAPGAYNIYQLIAIANASGTGRVEEFLRTKKPFSAGNLTYLQRANRKIQEVTNIATNFPSNGGMGGFKYASAEQRISKTASYTIAGTLYFPAQYSDDIKSGKRKITIRSNDVPIDAGEIVTCMTYSGGTICDVRIEEKNRMSLTRIEKAYGKHIARSLEQKFGDGKQFYVIKFTPYEEQAADDDKWQEVLIEKDGVKLTREEIKDHFSKPLVRKKIMARIKGKPILVYLGVSKNEYISKRNNNGKPIVIKDDNQSNRENPDNYFYWVERRLLSIHQVFGSKTDIGFIDLDLHGDYSLVKAKQYAKEVSSKIKEQYNVNPIIYQNGSGGIHVEFKLGKPTSINNLRYDLKGILDDLNKDWDDVTTSIVKDSGMRSDVSALHDKGSIMVPGSLCEIYGKEKKKLSESNLDDNFGIKNIHDNDYPFQETGAIVEMPVRTVGNTEGIGSYYAELESLIMKEAKRHNVQTEYLWMWDDTNKRLYVEKNVENEKEIPGITHSVFEDKYNFKPNPRYEYRFPRGFVTYYNNGKVEVDTYGDSFDNIISEAKHAVLSTFDLRDKDFSESEITGVRDKALNISASNILPRIWKLAEFISMADEEQDVDLSNLQILTPVEVCELENDWLIPCEEVYELREFYEQYKSSPVSVPVEKTTLPPTTEKILEQTEEIVSDWLTSSDDEEDIKNIEALSGVDSANADIVADDGAVEILKGAKNRMPLFGYKVEPIKDLETGEIISKWPDVDVSKLDEKAQKIFDLKKMQSPKGISESLHDARVISLLKGNEDLTNKFLLPLIINSIGASWFNRYKHIDRTVGNSSITMFNSGDQVDIASMQERENQIAAAKKTIPRDVLIEELPKAKMYISEINKNVAELVNSYFSFANQSDLNLHEYVFKYLNFAMKKKIAKDNDYKEERHAVCSVCRANSFGQETAPTMVNISKKGPRMSREELSKGRIVWACEACKRKAEEIDEKFLNKINSQIKKASENISELEFKKNRTEDEEMAFAKNKSLLSGLQEDAKKYIKEKRIYEGQMGTPRLHTWCPNENCPGQRIPLTAIDWDNNFWDKKESKEVLEKLISHYGMIIPDDMVQKFKVQKAEDEDNKDISFGKEHDAPKWMQDVPFICPFDGVKFTLESAKGKGTKGRAGFLWPPYQRTVWVKLSGEKKGSAQSSEEDISDDIQDGTISATSGAGNVSFEESAMSSLSDLTKNIMLTIYWGKRKDFINRIQTAGLSFDKAINNPQIVGELRNLYLYEALRDFSLKDDETYVNWLAGNAMKDVYVANKNTVVHSKTYGKPAKEYQDIIHIPVLQKWIDLIMGSKNTRDENLKKLNIDKEWLVSEEKDGISSKTGESFGTYFIAKVTSDMKEKGERHNLYSGFKCNLKATKIRSGTKKSGNIKILRVLDIWEIPSDSIGKFTEEEINGIIDIKDEGKIQEVIRSESLKQEMSRHSYNKVFMDKDVFSLPEGSFVLCKALAIPGHSDHSAIQVVRNVRNNKDYQDLFVKLGEEQMGEGEKNSKFWASFKKKLMGIKAKSKGVDVSIEEIKMAIDESEEEANIEKNAGLTVMSARDPLSKYKSKRDFDETKEPEGKVEMKNKHRFVIQSHKATNWHFDLRLENDNGVLQSWTIPKHKIPRASEKLLAIETEPHPVSYIKFQGEIDEGYGKGTVEIFASGTYVPIEITKDKKIFEIKTGKAKGTYVLVKTGGKRWMFLRAREEVKK